MPAFPGQRESGGSAATPPATPAALPKAVVEPCVCGHARDAHTHYRRGTDCGACGAQECGAFRPEGGAVRKTLRRFRLSS